MTLGRPPLPRGAHGKITTKKVDPGVYESRANFKCANGTIKRFKRRGTTETKAENNLKRALTEAAQQVLSGQIETGAKFKVVAEKWFTELQRLVRQGSASPNTARSYRGFLDNHVLPELGEVRFGSDLTATTIIDLRSAKLDKGMPYATWRHVQKVISAVCGHAIMHKVVSRNPVRDVPSLSKMVTNAKPKKIRSLTKVQRTALFAKLSEDRLALKQDVPDMLRGLLATGVRISELLACCGSDLERINDKPFLRVDHRVIWVKGQGVVRVEREANAKGAGQLLELPKWAWSVFNPRKLKAGPDGPLFPSPKGKWRHPTTAVGNVSTAMDRAGFEWVTSHVMRKTVATVLAEAGLPVRQISTRLGHTKEATTERHYIGAVESDPAVMEALDGMEESG